MSCEACRCEKLRINFDLRDLFCTEVSTHRHFRFFTSVSKVNGGLKTACSLKFLKVLGSIRHALRSSVIN